MTLLSSTAAVIAVRRTIVVVDSLSGLAATSTHFSQESVQLVLGGTANPRSIAGSTAVIVAPVLSAFPFLTVTSEMTGLSTDAADDASCEVLFLRAVVFAMSNFATVLTGLVFVVSQSTVESSELTELVSLQLVLAFGNRCSLHT